MRVTAEQILAAYDATGSVWKAGKRLGIAGQTVHRHLAKAGRSTGMRWSTEEVGELRAMVAAGRPATEIALALGRSFAGITCKLNELGLKVARAERSTGRSLKGQLSRSDCLTHLEAMETAGLSVTKYAAYQRFPLNSFVTILQNDIPDQWFAYCERVSILPARSCPECDRTFHPLHRRQICCTRRCTYRNRTDRDYFGGRRRETVGLAEQICFLCGRDDDPYISSHHVRGKDHDPNSECLIALCRGCHKAVTFLASRDWVFNEKVWECLVHLCTRRAVGDQCFDPPGHIPAGFWVNVEVRPQFA